MNQYGMNGGQYGMSGYGQSMYPQMQNPYGVDNVSYVSGVNWVQGVEGAKALRIKPNDKVLMLDSENEGVMYIKVSDNFGMCTLRAFGFNEITDQLINNKNNKNNTDMSEYVKISELDAKVEEVVNRLLGGGTNEQPV